MSDDLDLAQAAVQFIRCYGDMNGESLTGYH